ncbi:hypothetical protein [Antricoccus suffuscus]|uniref:hypothetical protein n=1 Tax=Antricoccus suffuscus TaxID=1629062 RepID=UPI0011B28205|nr:hypothetical protein [Antricoccus suffuscus]
MPAATAGTSSAPDPCSYASYAATPSNPYTGQAPDTGTKTYDQGRPPPAGETYESGYWVGSYCPGAAPTYTWVRNGTPGVPGAPAAPVLADPQQLAVDLRSTTAVTTPALNINPYLVTPDGRRATMKNAYTWFWVDVASWSAVTPRIDAGPVWVEATITPVSLVIEPNDGTTPTKTCSGPGTPIGEGVPMSQPSPTCSVAFAAQTYGGTWPMTVHVVYSVTWTGFDGTQAVGGTLADITSPAVAYPIAVLTAKPELVDPNLPPSK